MTPDDIAAQRALEHNAACGTCDDRGWVRDALAPGSTPCPECEGTTP